PSLLDAAGDRVGGELLVPLTAGVARIDLRGQVAGLAVTVGVDAGKGADPGRGGPGAGTLAVRDRNALAALYQRQHLATRNDQRVQGLHRPAPNRAGAAPEASGSAGRSG